MDEILQTRLDLDEAITYFDKGIEVEPDFATIYHNKGWFLNKALIVLKPEYHRIKEELLERINNVQGKV